MVVQKTRAQKVDELATRIEGDMRAKVTVENLELDADLEDEDGEEDMNPKMDAPTMETGVQCAASVQGGGHCKTVRVLGKLYCQRHLDRFEEVKKSKNVTTKTMPAASTDQLCSVKGCKKPRLERSVQCQRHYNKALRNNESYRQRAREAMNEGDGSWKNPIKQGLIERRQFLMGKVAEIDAVIVTMQGL